MKKSYCDNCGAEITRENIFSELSVEVATVRFKVSWPDAIPCDYDVCKYCVIDAIVMTDDRPSNGSDQ